MNADFARLADHLGVGRAPAGWLPIADMPLLVLVGLTGVGKSSAVDALRTQSGEISLLPNRRKIADLLVIPTVQRWDGEPPTAVTDRRRRFDYTARYRQRHSGGLAHALSRLVLQRLPSAAPLSGSGAFCIFDGLRGADEVTFAAQNLPLARFAVLNAPDVVRVERLLQRKDGFDRLDHTVSHPGFRWEDVAEGRELFSHDEQVHLTALVSRGEVEGAELAAKIAIVVAERRNYDPYAAVETLRLRAPHRTILVDTTTNAPSQVAAAIHGLLATPAPNSSIP